MLADEYDKFSNEMIPTFDSENLAWVEMMKTSPFLKSFWSSIKAGTESCFKRIFITGVTSMSMTHLASISSKTLPRIEGSCNVWSIFQVGKGHTCTIHA